MLDNREAQQAVEKIPEAVDRFSLEFPNSVVHTITLVSSGQHGGWDLTVIGTEPTNFDEVVHSEIVK